MEQPLEETPEVAAAVHDDTTVPQLMTGGGPDEQNPVFQEPEPGPARPPVNYRTGAEQPWDPEDLAVADGRDPTPENIERARRDLEQHGAAAIERTVP